MLALMHRTHAKLQKTMMNIAGKIWWPAIKRDIVNMINDCRVCLEERSSQPELPDIDKEKFKDICPMQLHSIDIAQHAGQKKGSPSL